MNTEPKVSIHPDADLLAASVAARLLTRLVDIQNERGTATVVLTGGTLGIGARRAVEDVLAGRAVWHGATGEWSVTTGGGATIGGPGSLAQLAGSLARHGYGTDTHAHDGHRVTMCVYAPDWSAAP